VHFTHADVCGGKSATLVDTSSSVEIHRSGSVSVGIKTDLGALRSIGRNVVVTVLTLKSSDFSLILNMAAFRGEVTPSILAAWTGAQAHMTHRNRLVLMIIVFNVCDAACAPFGFKALKVSALNGHTLGCSHDFSGVRWSIADVGSN
jgi:hypothetical protein